MAKSLKSILIMGSFTNGALENYYIQGFAKLGFVISKYDISAPYYRVIQKSILHRAIHRLIPNVLLTTINDKVEAYLAGKKFDVILVFKGMSLFPSTVEKLKFHTMLLANYNPDHPYLFYSHGSGNTNVTNSVKFYDLYFSYSHRIVQQIKLISNVESHRIPFACFNYSVQPNNTFSNLSDKLVFIGSYDKQRANFLSVQNLPDIVIYGNDKWEALNTKTPMFKSRYAGKALFGEQYIEAMQQAAGVLNLLRTQNISEASHNMRTFEIPGSKGLMFSPRTIEQEEFFADELEAMFFDTTEELVSKFLFIKSNPLVADKIKAAGYQRCLRSNYSYDRRAYDMKGIMEATVS